jgi:hypothetical protein
MSEEKMVKLGAPNSVTPHGNAYDATDFNTTIEEEHQEEKEQLEENEG